MAAHSTVVYAEPNIEVGRYGVTETSENDYKTEQWCVDDEYDRAPRLEDYCIALNIEVEVGSRDTQGTRKTITLEWSRTNDNKPTVSFMAGTKIGGYDIDGYDRKVRVTGDTNVENLTTYYADMYVGDLIHYGTTEMIGIKSVNIQYEKGCVPIISIKFTDVRGYSLFQPQELNRNNLYDGIKGIDKDNIAQSFFQCFFKLPMPKFTITIKGFYGKPVAYVMMCDHFETNFNSETGDYDVDTRFIGYSYSFMTDIAFEALLAAPYSDFKGREYWNSNASRFLIKSKNGDDVTMPTLMEFYQKFYEIINDTNTDIIDTTLSEEERYHTQEIAKLRDIVDKYKTWYETLFNFLKKQYNKRYCFEFRDNINDENSDWHKIILLTNSATAQYPNLSEEYKQYPEDLKRANNNLNAAIKDFNSDANNFKQIKEISEDFSKYTRIKLFNNCYINHNTRKIEFGGFAKECNLNKTEILNRMFYGVETSGDETPLTIQEKTNKLKEFTLSTIYGDGTDQYTSAYLIEVDYSDIIRRINILVEDASKSDEEKDNEKKRKEHNRTMLEKLTWYPSVENFTKIMMAHVETFMHMLYCVQEKAVNRSPQSLGITIGPDGNACDINVNTENVSAFPRVIKDEIDDDGITRKVDTWVGEFGGAERFIEEDMVNGLFNGISEVERIYKESTGYTGTSSSLTEDEYDKPSVKFPITSFDFFLSKSPYGDTDDITNNPYAFVGKVMLRMYNILQLSNLKYEHSFTTDIFKKLGEIEAENFHDLKCLQDGKVKKLLGDVNNEASMSPQSMIKCVLNTGETFQGEDKLWEGEFMNKTHFTPRMCYVHEGTNSLGFALQGNLFNVIENFIKILRSGKIDIDNEDVTISTDKTTLNKTDVDKIKNSDNKHIFNILYIRDDFKVIEKALSDASTASVSGKYTEFYNIIKDASLFNKDEYGRLIKKDGVFRPKLSVTYNGDVPVSYGGDMVVGGSIGGNTLAVWYDETSGKIVPSKGGDKIKLGSYAYDANKMNDFLNEAENGNITSWTFTECLGVSKNKKYYNLKLASSLIVDFRNQNKEKKTEKTPPPTNFSQNQRGEYVDEFGTSIGKSQITSTTKETSNDAKVNISITLNSRLEERVLYFLMGLDAIDYKEINSQLASNKTFVYLPKLAILQIGAALNVLDDYTQKANVVHAIQEKVPIPTTFHELDAYLDSTPSLVRLSYVKYYRQWRNRYGNDINEVLSNKEKYKKLWSASYENNTRLLFNESNSFVNGLNNELMVPVLIAKGTIFAKIPDIYDEQMGNLHATTVESYLDGFLTRLRELNNIKVERSDSAVRLAQEPCSVTESMKKDLYRYLKLVYERWIPLTDEKEWAYETFFGNDDPQARGNVDADGNGHTFRFIDSYYNKIGNRLLLNPQVICDLITRTIETKDVNTMMLGFMADVLGKNKCMLYSIQNFLDLADENSMSLMFKPIPYNSMSKPRKHPDFVIVYPYQPSRYLNVDNGDFNDDSFMLNNEFSTPLAIRSRNEGDRNKTYYRIPAFGVSYGKQYQSFFKKVNVGMKSPIATVQSITAKHAILKSSQDVTQTTLAQDAYDIYASQSYTCEVEMMGCAWVQPLMYFVLTNVPMFKGSYMIQKVTHTITPGNMTTNFIGVRMPNVANKIEDEIFTDYETNSSYEYQSSSISRANVLANVDNDCPYKVYPLYESDVTVGKDEMENAQNAMKKLIELGFTKVAAAGICGNIYKESTWRLHVGNPQGKGAFGLCQWTSDGGRKAKLIKFSNGSLSPTFEQQLKFIWEEWQGSQEYRDTVAPAHFNDLQNTTDPKTAAIIVCNYYERPFTNKTTQVEKEAEYSTRKSKAHAYYNNYNDNSSSIEKKIDSKQNRYDAFLNAVQKSLASTNRSTKIAKLVEDEPQNSSEKQAMNKNYMPPSGIKIVQQNNGREHLPIVFDIILNGYYEYVKELYWVVPDNDGNVYNDLPSSIHVVLVDEGKENPSDRKIGIYQSTKPKPEGQFNNPSDLHNLFLTAIAKRYNMVKPNEKGTVKSYNEQEFTKEVIVPKIALGAFNEVLIKDCDTLTTTENMQKGSEISSGDKGVIDGWDVGKACQHLISHAHSSSQKECAKYVELAIAAGGGPLSQKISTHENGANSDHATNLRYDGILAKHGFEMIDYGDIPPRGNPTIPLQAGDVAIIGKNVRKGEGGRYHACMYTSSKGWISDFFQQNMTIYRTTYPYAIYRFHNKKKENVT